MTDDVLGFSIRIFLADGTPDGLRVVEKTNWSGIGLMFSRAQFPQLRDRHEFLRPGVYVLFGPTESAAFRHRIYVGEADELRARIAQHASTKDFWTRAVVFTSKDDDLNQAHVRYLESRLLERAKQARRAEVENVSVPAAPKLSAPEVAYAEAFLRDMLLIYPILGLEAFELAEAPVRAAPLLRLVGVGAKGSGRDTPEGFIVSAGSQARSDTVPSIQEFTLALRARLLTDGVFVHDGDHLRMTQDYVFESPSSAASVLLGRSANGRTEWKDERGRTLRELQEQALAPIQITPPEAPLGAEA